MSSVKPPATPDGNPGIDVEQTTNPVSGDGFQTSEPVSSIPTQSLSDSTPSSTPSSTPTNAGVIAGGVISGVVLLALIIGAFILVRRRKRRMAPSSEFLAQNPHWRAGTPNSLSELNGDKLPLTQGSYIYPLAPEKQQRGSELA
ncbi:hypothetical protein E1B28_002532 [Marasmius oreades]|uniref:Uncharacterized protein n=1 Tax=Marasmius oreades TaxID=181124 RepID=A0A9P7RNV0_9AGAR|nr:uncharacterized protein E1B28_002532 [Marasmius oreades]KAG7086586.1 hypothetical protein E1B28_002532 [Marasmius oreades]